MVSTRNPLSNMGWEGEMQLKYMSAGIEVKQHRERMVSSIGDRFVEAVKTLHGSWCQVV